MKLARKQEKYEVENDKLLKLEHDKNENHFQVPQCHCFHITLRHGRQTEEVVLPSSGESCVGSADGERRSGEITRAAECV